MNKTDDIRDVVVVGAGFAGLYLIRKLRDELGLDVQVFERGDDVGGTWYWNRYPGARCDIESVFYSFSFDEGLMQDWTWSEVYASQQEILSYLNFVADRFDLRRSVRFGSTVTAAAYDEASATWTVAADDGTVTTSRYLIAATGNLSVPLTPTFEGLTDFEGQVLHTGDWPHEPVDFTGKRVAVIGTGSSGVQVIPEIARDADELTVFQRTPMFSVPARNRPLTAQETSVTKSMYSLLNETRRYTYRGVIGEQPLGAAADVDPTIAQVEFERRWWRSAFQVQGLFSDVLTSAESNAIVADKVRAKISASVDDPETAALLEPHGYPLGAKRLVLGTGFYETFNRPGVRLVSIKDTPIERFTADGLVVGGTEYSFDAIVLATGYDAMTGALARIDVRGRRDRSLADAWSAGPSTYLGVSVADFPNFFMITGPGSPSVLANMVAAIEQHVEWVADYITFMRVHGIVSAEPTLEAQERWVAHVNELADATLYSKAASWYLGANVPGKPRIFMPYIGGLGPYRRTSEAVAEGGYREFTHVAAQIDRAEEATPAQR